VAPEHALAVAAIAQAGGGAAVGGSIGDAGAGGSSGDGVVLAHGDPLAGLQSLARAWLSELRSVAGARVVAITGSTGKTSTKDILAALLSPHLRTVASPENHNTEIGLPLAILAAPAGTEALVLELAMRGSGQIAELTEIAEPDVGVIVNVGPVHLGLLGSLEAIAAAKAELIAGLGPGATAIVPAGEALLEPYLRDDVRTITFGERGDVGPAESRADGRISISHGGQEIVLRPSFGQAHNLRNLLAAVAAARALGVTPGGEVTVRFSSLRGERVQLSEGIVLIDDCYNANPMSMRCAIDDLAETAPGRSVAVLGDMLELGPGEQRYHQEIGVHAAQRGVDVLVTVGPLAGEMARAFTGGTTGEAHSVADAPAAAELLRGVLAPGDTVLVKGSRGVGLERVGQALLAREDPPARTMPTDIPDGTQATPGASQATAGAPQATPSAPQANPGAPQRTPARPQAGRR
jgi:UDP-N-acetylmuramoyl-tripeptide--D-alanyl-D-alanine ligase